MQRKSGLIKIKRKTLRYIIFILLILALVTPVLADYLGPNRTVTEWSSVCKVVLYECQFVRSKNAWRYRRTGDWSCSLESKPWQVYPSEPSSQGCFTATAGDQYWGQEDILQEVTTSYPPATINGTLQNCTLQNGWCVTSPGLELSAGEPLSGYNILAIEGSLNGNTFACPNANCSIALNEGDNNFTYWALSSWGDSSIMDSLSAKVDTVPPDVGLDLSGSNGTNGWFVSPVTLSATGSDSTSGLVSASLSIDGGAWQSSTTLNEGVYNVTVSASDNAGNVATSSTTVSVDTTTPSLNISFNGTTGKNGWYVSTTLASVSASDATSGIGALEVSVDGGIYQPYTSSVPFSDGLHAVQFKATDNAGNFTESTVQSFSVDTTPPEIFLAESWSLGETITYKTQDPSTPSAGQAGSGLASLRVVIEDEDERFAKVAWNETVSGVKFTETINWDGKFKDGTVAPPGTYLVWIKASDAAGNEYIVLGRVVVPEPNVLFSLFRKNDSSTEDPLPPDDLSEPDDISTATPLVNLTFGGLTTEVKETKNQVVSFAIGDSSSRGSTSSNVLWGTTAAAIIAAATAYALEERRKRKEEEDRQRAEIEAEIAGKQAQRVAALEANKIRQWLEGQAILNARIAEAKNHGASEQEIADLKKLGATVGFGAASDSAKTLTSSYEMARGENDRRELEEEQNLLKGLAEKDIPDPVDLQAGLAAYYAAMRLGEIQAAEEHAANTKPGWWKKAWNKTVDWVDANQTLASILTGLAVAAVTVAIVVALPAIALTFTTVAIASLAAAAVTATLVSVGTMALNHAKDRPLTTNLVSNVFVGGTTALVVTGLTLAIAAGFVTQTIISVGNTVAGLCARNPSAMHACSQIGPALDAVEQFGLGAEMAVQLAFGNQDGAAQTAIEYQLEAMDGGAPGNSIAAELGEQLAKLGDEATELIAKHGEEIVPLLIKHGDDAVEIIGKYGDDGITVLTKFGDETEEVISLIRQKDDQAIKVLKATDLESAEKLFTTLDEDVLDYVIKQEPGAVVALSRWSDKELLEHGPELALRAEKDSIALKAINDLINSGPINPKKLNEKQQGLIEIIAMNSTQYTDEGQILLGKWVDYDNGFAEVARDTGSAHYNPHPDVWNLLGKLGNENREDVAWLINKDVIQTGIDKGLPFEYTFDGILAKDIFAEQKAIQLIFSDATESEIKLVLRSDYLPIRMQELQELKKAGYEFVFDEINVSAILSLP